MRGQDSHETMEVRPFSGHRHRRGKASPQGVPGRSTGPGKDTTWSIWVWVRPHRAPHGASLPNGPSLWESDRPGTGDYPL